MITEELIHKFREASDRYAKAKAKSVYLDHYRGVLLARMMKLAQEQGVSSVGAQEREAKASDSYLVHLHGHRAAIEQELLTRAEMQACEYAIECWRTEQASIRAEKKAYSA